MAMHINKSGGALVLPDGTEVPRGATANVPASVATNAGVAEWIGAGWLEPVKPALKK